MHSRPPRRTICVFVTLEIFNDCACAVVDWTQMCVGGIQQSVACCKVSLNTGFPLDIPSFEASKWSFWHRSDAWSAASDESGHGAVHDPGVPGRRLAAAARHPASPEDVRRRNASRSRLCFSRDTADRNWGKRFHCHRRINGFSLPWPWGYTAKCGNLS